MSFEVFAFGFEDGQRRHLPPELLDGAQVVTTEQDVLDVIKAA